MKYIPALLLLLLMTSCIKDEQPLTNEQIKSQYRACLDEGLDAQWHNNDHQQILEIHCSPPYHSWWKQP